MNMVSIKRNKRIRITPLSMKVSPAGPSKRVDLRSVFVVFLLRFPPPFSSYTHRSYRPDGVDGPQEMERN